jgi:hypothetical protein
MQRQERFVLAARYSFWAHCLGTLAAFFHLRSSEMEGKRRQGDGFQTASFDAKYSPAAAQ